MSNEIKEMGTDFDIEVVPASTAPPKIHAKPVLKLEDIPAEKRQSSYTAEDLKRITAEVLATVQGFRPGETQTVSKAAAPIVDWSKLTQEDALNMDFPMEAVGFFTGDVLKVNLKDSNYEARWVSTNSQRLGYMKSIGFTYVVSEDLEENLESSVYKDAQDHYTINDVVLMRIPKSKYFPALRASQVRSENTMKSTRAMSVANNFMVKTAGAEYNDAAQNSQMSFYNAGGKV